MQRSYGTVRYIIVRYSTVLCSSTKAQNAGGQAQNAGGPAQIAGGQAQIAGGQPPDTNFTHFVPSSLTFII